MIETILGVNLAELPSGWCRLGKTADGVFCEGDGGVQAVVSPPDRKVEFVCFEQRVLAHVKSAMGYRAITRWRWLCRLRTGRREYCRQRSDATLPYVCNYLEGILKVMKSL